MSILIRGADGNWREPAGSGYENEAALQEILFQHPTLVPGVSGEVIACREFQSGVGPADVVILDADGAITIVESKLAANPQVRREVIGQILDYASRLWQMSAQEFEDAWSRAAPDHRSPFVALDDTDGRIRAAVQENLEVGRFNLVLAVDRINDDLSRIVTFLNAVTKPSTGVIAVEFARVYDGATEILIPTAYGVELVEAKAASSYRNRARWTVEQVHSWVVENDPESAPVFDAFLEGLHANGFRVGGGRAQTPSMWGSIRIPGLGEKFPLLVYTYPDRGAVLEVRFSDFNGDAAAVDRFAELVSAVPGIPVSVEEVRAAEYRKRPNVPLREFTASAVRQLTDAVGSMKQAQDTTE